MVLLLYFLIINSENLVLSSKTSLFLPITLFLFFTKGNSSEDDKPNQSGPLGAMETSLSTRPWRKSVIAPSHGTKLGKVIWEISFPYLRFSANASDVSQRSAECQITSKKNKWGKEDVSILVGVQSGWRLHEITKISVMLMSRQTGRQWESCDILQGQKQRFLCSKAGCFALL